MTITKKIREAINDMVLNPHRASIAPSELKRKCTAYKELTTDQINFVKEQTGNSVNRKGDTSLLKEPKISSISNKDDKSTFTIDSPNPLQPEELAKLVGADGVNTRVDRTWLKSHKNNTWTYSILTVTTLKDFYSVEELGKKLSQILPKCGTMTLPKVNTNTNYGLLTLNLADIHAGSLGNDKTPFPTMYTKQDMRNRLKTFVEKTHEFTQSKKYEEVWLINLGDALNGWDSQTTRKGHEVPSLSNKDQFDIFLELMCEYYETIFKSNLTNKYKVINILNDNHIGSSLNYIVMKAIELYLSQKYPQVEFIQQWDFIKTYTYGKHAISLTHGKDEKIMKYPMKAILDDKLDNWLNQYYLHQGFTPTQNHLHLIKGDLHLKNEQFGKFGRYVNVPSVMGTSDYIALNYGFSRSGALIEEYLPNSANVNSKTIWFQ